MLAAVGRDMTYQKALEAEIRRPRNWMASDGLPPALPTISTIC